MQAKGQRGNLGGGETIIKGKCVEDVCRLVSI
jgi:hypothetical protein